MSTRRARIKAVTSLPPRKKNTDKSVPKKDHTAKTDTDRTEVTKNLIDPNTIENENEVKTISSAAETSPPNSNNQTLLKPEALGSDTLAKNNVFLSPRRKNSPRKTFASPLAPSPKILKHNDGFKILQKIGTPQTPNINNCDELQITDSVISKVNHNEDLHKPEKNLGTHGIILETDDEAGMDGIVPLQPEAHGSKTIVLLNNENISENVEALFDPIIPLPSPGKVRPKLKPVPRLGPQRRNSIQGSASESEDESRRSLHTAGASTPAPPRQRYDSHTSISTLQSLPNRDISRVRNDSICSTTSQVTVQPAAASPIREKQAAKVRRPEVNRRMMASKRRRDMVKREALTMYDLIFCNPTSNPIVPDEDEIKAMEENEKDIVETKKEVQKMEEETPATDAAPVPQIKLGPNGEIMLDEASLVIKNTGSDRGVLGVVREGAWGAGGGGRYRRAARSADWPPAETVRFYRALATLGTDFTLMAQLFPDRSRKELKIKFKKEEKLNGAQVDKALRSVNGWDVGRLRDEFKEERTEAARRAQREQEQLQRDRRAETARLRANRSVRVRTSRATKAMESTMMPDVSRQVEKGIMTAEDIVEKAQLMKMEKRKKKDNTSTPAGVDPEMATMTRVKNAVPKKSGTDMVPGPSGSEGVNIMPQMPPNIETGSLVVLTVNDPTSPGKKMLQTYIAQGPHKLTPVALPATFLNSVVGYMKRNSIKGASTTSSPLLSPNSVSSQDSRTTSTSVSVIQSPMQRQRHSSFTITHL